MRRLLGISLEQETPKIDPYLCDPIPVLGPGTVATEGMVGDIKNWFRGKIDLRFKENATKERNAEKAAQIRARLAHKGQVKKGQDFLVTKLFVEDLYFLDNFVTDFDSFKKLFAQQKDYLLKLLKDIEPGVKDLVAKYKEAMSVSEEDLDKAQQILMDNVGMYLPKQYKSKAVNKVSNYVSLTKTLFGNMCLKIWTNDIKAYFAVIDSQQHYVYPKKITTLTKEECFQALDIIEDYQNSLYAVVEKIWNDALKDYHKSLNAFSKAHSDWNKRSPEDRAKLSKIADIVYEITADMRPLSRIGTSIIEASRSAQYYIVYSMESLENH